MRAMAKASSRQYPSLAFEIEFAEVEIRRKVLGVDIPFVYMCIYFVRQVDLAVLDEASHSNSACRAPTL